MNKYSLNLKNVSLAVAGMLIIAFAFCVENISQAFKKMSVAGGDMRISQVNSCTDVMSTAEDTPHFSGCNSVL